MACNKLRCIGYRYMVVIVLTAACFSCYIIVKEYMLLFGVRFEKDILPVTYKKQVNTAAENKQVSVVYSVALRNSVIKLLKKIVLYVIDACHFFKIECFLASGTLLGQYRSKEVFSYDEDGDFHVHIKDYERFVQLSKLGLFHQFANNFTLSDRINNDDNVEKLHPYRNFDIIIRKIPNGYTRNGLFARAVEDSTKIYVDFFLLSDLHEDGKIYVVHPFSSAFSKCVHCIPRIIDSKRQFKLDKKYIYPLKTCTMENNPTALCPFNSEKYLSYVYGSNFTLRPFIHRLSGKVFVYFCAVYFTCNLTYIIFKFKRNIYGEHKVRSS